MIPEEIQRISYLPPQQLHALESCVTKLRNEGTRAANISYLYLEKF